MKDIIKLIRPKHYIKNVLLFLPIFFSGKLFDLSLLPKVVLAFISFSLMASVVYIINDINDREKDSLHPIKKYRPIASGRISVTKACVIMIVLFLLSMGFQYLAVGSIFDVSTIYLLVYLLLNIAYSIKLKQIPILDVSILVSGFILRVLYGASIVDIEVSNWLYLTIMSLSFYLGLGKRRNEMTNVKKETRVVLKYYTRKFLDKNMYVCLTLAVVFYSLWCIDIASVGAASKFLIYTIPLIIIILMKYSLNIEKVSHGDPVDVLFRDKVLMLLIAIYGLTMFGIVYFI